MVSDGAALSALHCQVCSASLLPSQSTVQLVVSGLNMTVEALKVGVEQGKPAPLPCPACQGAMKTLVLRLREVHVCTVCGASCLPGGNLYALTSGRFGRLKPVEPPPEEPPPPPAASLGLMFRSLLSTLAHAGNARKYTYIALSIAFFAVVVVINARHTKPIKLDKNGLPVGDLGMRPESAKAFRDTMNMFDTMGGGEGSCPNGARWEGGSRNWRCMKDNVAEGPSHTDSCNGPNGRVVDGTWRAGKQEGRFVATDCNETVLLEEHYTAGKLDADRVEYRSDGTVHRRQAYSEGIKQGVYKEYYPNGKLAVEGYFHKDQPAGHWTWFNPEGRTTAEKSY